MWNGRNFTLQRPMLLATPAIQRETDDLIAILVASVRKPRARDAPLLIPIPILLFSVPCSSFFAVFSKADAMILSRLGSLANGDVLPPH